jgi:hypothetical protein
MSKKYIEILKSFFQKKKSLPHVCEHKYKGCVSHFGMVSDIKQSIENPTWYHYPSMEIRKEWLNNGILKAGVFQSHWDCICNNKKVFFFLTVTPDNIDNSEVESYNPLYLKCNAAKSLKEVTDGLINEFCNKKA